MMNTSTFANTSNIRKRNYALLPTAFLSMLCLLFFQSGIAAESFSKKILNTAEISSIHEKWKFKPGDNPAWAQPEFDDIDWSTITVPSTWPEAGFPAKNQFAWYRLRLTLSTDIHQTIGLRFAAVRNSYEIYAGGIFIGGVGKLPPKPEINYDKTNVYHIPHDAISADGSLMLAVRVWGGSNLAVRKSGGGIYLGKILIGPYTQLIRALDNEQIPRLILAALFLMTGLFFLYFYKRAPVLPSFLWFGLTSIVLAIYILTQTQWKYNLDLSFLVLEKIESGSFYLFVALFLQTQWTIVDRPINKFVRTYQIYFMVAAIALVLIPGLEIHYHTRKFLQLSLIPGIVLMFWVVAVQAKAGQNEAKRLLPGILIFGAFGINDLLLNMQIIQSISLVSYGFLAILAFMLISLAAKFASLMTSIEQQVIDRTEELNQAKKKFEELAQRDPLTSLLNRRGFSNAAEIEAQRFVRTGRPFTIVLSDIDLFKKFNDKHGHACGDKVLQATATLLCNHVRDVDEVARWGGEEFILLLPETDIQGAKQIAEKLRESVCNADFMFENKHLNITMTFGIATCQKKESLDACISRADAALYEGKANGRNQVVINTSGG